MKVSYKSTRQRDASILTENSLPVDSWLFQKNSTLEDVFKSVHFRFSKTPSPCKREAKWQQNLLILILKMLSNIGMLREPIDIRQKDNEQKLK